MAEFIICVLIFVNPHDNTKKDVDTHKLAKIYFVI